MDKITNSIFENPFKTSQNKHISIYKLDTDDFYTKNLIENHSLASDQSKSGSEYQKP